MCEVKEDVVFLFPKTRKARLSPKNPPPGSTLTQLEIDNTNKVVEPVLDKRGEGDHTGNSKCGKYTIYTTVERMPQKMEQQGLVNIFHSCGKEMSHKQLSDV